MKFSIIMPSYLGNYAGAASRRDEKIVRAVESVIAQTFQDWELWVVADGCDSTMEIVRQFTDERVHAVKIPKSKIWSGEPRNTGIAHATGEYIVYLDIDDYYGENHLQIIADNLNDKDWVFYNDYIYRGEWVERNCDVRKLGQNGTSNVCHRRSLGAKWSHTGYAHDHHFTQGLIMKSLKYVKILTPEYFVMHVPGQYDL